MKNSRRKLMKKKITDLAICAMVFALSVSAQAQQPAKMPRIGYVSGSGDRKTPGPLVEAFRQGLRDLGYIEGKNILVEYRYVEGGWIMCPLSWPNSCNLRLMCLSRRS